VQDVISNHGLTAIIDKGDVNDELNYLHSREVLFPLQVVSEE